MEVEEFSSQHTADKEGSKEEGGGGEEHNTPFEITKYQKETTYRPRKKQKSDKHVHVNSMVLS